MQRIAKEILQAVRSARHLAAAGRVHVLDLTGLISGDTGVDTFAQLVGPEEASE
jgi:hypothetical protein